jgi:ketosteroid isomerase-like protein
MSEVQTAPRAAGQPGPPAVGVSDQTVEEIVSRFHAAYDARDIDTLVELFAETGDWRLAPGTFTGKAAIRHLLEWDARLSPTASCRTSGVGIIVHGNVAVSERLIEQVFEGIPSTYPAVTVFELNEAGKIEHARSYYERLSILRHVASKYPGVKRWLFRKIINYIVAQTDKGLQIS